MHVQYIQYCRCNSRFRNCAVLGETADQTTLETLEGEQIAGLCDSCVRWGCSCQIKADISATVLRGMGLVLLVLVVFYGKHYNFMLFFGCFLSVAQIRQPIFVYCYVFVMVYSQKCDFKTLAHYWANLCQAKQAQQ